MAPKIMLIPGDYWHAPGPLVTSIHTALEPLDCVLETFVDPAAVPFQTFHDFDLIILAKGGENPAQRDETWLSENQEALLETYVTQGGRLLAIHGGVCGYREGGPVRRIMKGHFVSHPPEHDLVVRVVDHEHPVCRQIEEFSIFDEQYQLDVDPAETRVLLESNSPTHGVQIAGWTHPVGEGYFLGLTPGHTKPVLAHPAMQKLIRQSVVWLLQE